MPMRIAIKDKVIEPLSKLPDEITGVSIIYAADPFHPDIIPEEVSRPLSLWLYELCMKTVDDGIMFNGVFIDKKDIKKCTVFRKVHVYQG